MIRSNQKEIKTNEEGKKTCREYKEINGDKQRNKERK
jgi:hypothetical protein